MSPRIQTLTLAFIGIAFFFHSAAQAQVPQTTAELRLEVSEGGRRLSGEVRWTIVNTTDAPLPSVTLWLYPNLFEEPAQGLEDRLVPWIYPQGHSRGSMDVSAAWWNERALAHPIMRFQPVDLPGRGEVARALGVVDLGEELGPRQMGVLRLAFTVEVPTRRARFGHFRGSTALSDGFYPRPVPDFVDRDITRPFSPIEIEASVQVPQGLSAILHDRIDPDPGASRVVTVGPVTTDVLSLVLLKKMTLRHEKPATFVGQDLPLTDTRWTDRRQDRLGLPEGLPNLGKLDAGARILSVTQQALDLVGHKEEAKPLLLVEVPMWDELATPSGAQLFVSEGLYRLAPAEKALWFHDLALARAIGIVTALRQRPSEEPERYVWAEAFGASLSERHSQEVHGKSQSMQELVGFASFIPLIDSLLYAPQIPFAEAYFRSVERRDPLRDEPWRFMNEQPDGGRLHGKLVDLVGNSRARAAIETIAAGQPVRPTLDRIIPDGSAWFLAQWMGRYPSVDYVLLETKDEPASGGQYLHTAVIERRGDSIREPVVVAFEDKTGHRAELVWPGQGRLGEVTWISGAPLKRVELDPSFRLVEDPELSDGHPLANNANSLRWRPPLLTRLLATFDAVSGDPYVTVSFALRRRFDITHSYHLDLDYTPRGYGAGFTYLRYFGKTRTLNARQLYIGPTLAVLRSHPSDEGTKLADGISREAATTGMLGLVLGSDERQYFWDPRRGLGWSLIGRYQGGRKDDGQSVNVVRGGAHLVGIIPMAVGHTLAAHGGVLGLWGNPVGTDLSTLSVRSALRGFDPDETYGRLGIYSGLEYRHVILDASRVSTPLFVWFDRFQGVLFAEAGTMSEPDGYGGLFSQERLFADVGYGLRAHLLLLGVQQYILAADFAVPISPLRRSYEFEQMDGTVERARRAPFKIVIGITQTF
jgi:hypothetical protein